MAPTPDDLGVVVDGQGAVGGEADVQLDPVGTESPGPDERLEGVLTDTAGRIGTPPVGVDRRYGHRFGTLLGLTVRPGADFGAEMAADPGRIPGKNRLHR